MIHISSAISCLKSFAHLSTSSCRCVEPPRSSIVSQRKRKFAQCTPQNAKKCKLMDSDEDDEEHQNESGTSANSQTTVPVLPLHQRPVASSQGPAASANSGDQDSEYSDEYSAQSQDSGRKVLYPDLYV